MKQFRLFIFGLAIAIGGLAYAGDSVSGVALPLTKESAAEHVQTQSGGKILSVDEKQEGTKLLFKVKVLHDDGKIKVYQMDAETGLEVQ
ncbi:MAG: hypothetical protein HN475_10185 [Piscirickettsiaceae bacterium]|mgnify:FL=1|jgi:uncharacterized membrane protein YkoI|nr:hypothetical protein [Piscirickettsiaceae bacterium]